MELIKNLEILGEKIESLRARLMQLLSYHSLTDESVVHCSQKLDILLTEYEKCKKECSPKDAA